MEDRSKLIQERHRLALRFNLSESQIEPELVPLMLAVEQSVNKIDQAATKINDAVKPVTYNNNYSDRASTWKISWGNITTAIGYRIVPISLIWAGFMLLAIGIFAVKSHFSDQQKIAKAERDSAFILRHFTQDENGDWYMPKENYEVTPEKSGIRLRDDKEP